ncbi:hypothetical protein C8F01DRAFT_1236904 [Mycena amicta]|nr:hypothetical protein C8F01DRAFT_1236904 [Mycena amicta]
MSLEELSGFLSFETAVAMLYDGARTTISLLNPMEDISFQFPTLLGIDSNQNVCEIMHFPTSYNLEPNIFNWYYRSSNRPIAYPVGQRASEDWTRITMDDLHIIHQSLSNQCNFYHLFQAVDCSSHAKFYKQAIMEIVPNQDLSLWAEICKMEIHILDTSNEFTLAGTFMTNGPTDDIFLFLSNIADATTGGFTIPSLQNSYYWSRDSAGLQPLCLEEMDLYTPPEILFTPYLRGIRLSVDELNNLRAAFPSHVTDPTTSYLAPNESSRLLFNSAKARIPEPFGWSIEPYCLSNRPDGVIEGGIGGKIRCEEVKRACFALGGREGRKRGMPVPVDVQVLDYRRRGVGIGRDVTGSEGEDRLGGIRRRNMRFDNVKLNIGVVVAQMELQYRMVETGQLSARHPTLLQLTLTAFFAG